MKAIIYLCMALLPSMINCSPDKDGVILQKILEKERKKNHLINDIFEPAKDGYLGKGHYSNVFKGKLHYSKKEIIDVAMKFTLDQAEGMKEYEMYRYLEAIDNPNVELYGIPSVYYFGFWKNYVMIGVTLLDSGFDETYRNKQDSLNELDLLIVCRETMRTLKYMHSCGVYHHDIRLCNVMFRRNDLFIIDFNQAERMYDIPERKPSEYNPFKLDTSSREIGIERSKHDWRIFLQCVSDFNGSEIYLKFANSNEAKGIIKEKEDAEEIENIIEKLEIGIDYVGIGEVLVEMANYIFGLKVYDETSAYDEIHDMCQTKIDKIERSTPALVHWLDGEEKKKAKREYKLKSEYSISSIPDPTKLESIDYLEIDYSKFYEKVARLKSDGSSSRPAKKTLTTSGSLDYADEIKKTRY